ncbi:MAG: hypothetical protein AAGD23_11905 [Pseudomonadota bacterium]
MGGGKKKPSAFSKLTSDPLRPDEFEAIKDELVNGPDRSAAIMGASLVELSLTRAIAARMVIKSQKQFGELFQDTGAPLATFYSKTLMGRAMGIYGQRVEGFLHTVRRVRNVFAHSPRSFSFELESIAVHLDKLPAAKLSESTLPNLSIEDAEIGPHRARFIAVAINLLIVLEDAFDQHIKRPKEVFIPDGKDPVNIQRLPRKSR